MNYYERRSSNPTLEFIRRCSEVLNVPLSELAGTLEPNIKAKVEPATQIEQRLEVIRTLPLKKQEIILRLLDSFLSAANKPEVANL